MRFGNRRMSDNVESQRGGLVMRREGHCRSGRSTGANGRYLVSGLVNMGANFASCIR